jgi:putative SOS response-associated peptidase YedK
MCGRFVLKSPAPKLAQVFAFKQLDFTAHYNIAPTQGVAALRAAGEERELAFLRWGLIPSWSKDPGVGNRLINARVETVAEKPSFRAAFKHRRCLILADGFFEWVQRDGKKQPYYITLRDGNPFAMAGLWEEWHNEDGEVIESCTIITTEANDFMRPLHSRMPVILDPENYAAWCQGTRTFTQLVDTNLYAQNRSLRTTRSICGLLPIPPERGLRSLLPAADLLLMLPACRCLASFATRATFSLPGETEAGSAGAQPTEG